MSEAMPRTVRVRGEGTVEAQPDAARISAGVSITHASLKKAREDAARQASAIIAAAKSAGVPSSDIQTSGYAVYPQYSAASKGKEKPAEIVGYDVRNTVSIVVRDLERLAEALDAVVTAGANQVSGPDFYLQQPEVHEEEARRRAMASARRRAEVLAAAAGARLGAVRSIVDGDQPAMPAPRMMRAMAADAATPTPIEVGTERITASVEVTWDLA
jgi:hypothetical protein